MLRINHLDNFGTNLTSGTSASDTTSPVNSVPSIAAPFWVAFDATNINSHYERKLITSKTATNILHSALSYDHTTAEEVRIVNPAEEFDAIYQPPQGYMINGKISVTDTGSGLTVALKTLAGSDPSESDPVFVRIGDSVQMIYSALSVTKADGTNWMNLGSAELATIEQDLFVYLGYNATDGVVIGFSRFPNASQYSDFSTTTTNEKYCAISTITTAASTDYYEVIGRFAATLSGGAGYTWSVPTFTAINLKQYPTRDSRDLTFTSTIVGFSGTPTQNCGYKFIGGRIFFDLFISGTSNSASFTASLPFNINMPSTSSQVQVCWVQDNGTASSGRSVISDGGASVTFGKLVTADGGFTTSGTKSAYLHTNASI